MSSTIRSDTPIDMTSYARELANLNAMSDEVLLDLSCVPDGVLKFELKIIPHRSGGLATVEASTLVVCGSDDFSENSIQGLVPILVINAAGNGLLAAACNDVFDFRFTVDR